jgi:hypothetical protein
MSECNYCSWQRMKAKYGHRLATSTEREKLWQAKCEEEGLDDSALLMNGAVVVDKNGNFVGWFAALPKQCAC